MMRPVHDTTSRMHTSPLARDFLEAPAGFDVLIADADKAARERLAVALESAGFTVATADNGAQALGTLRSAIVRLAIVDLMLPVMSGRDLTDIVRSTPDLADIPIVMTTSVHHAHMAAPGPVYVKPIRWDSLVRIVQLHLQRTSFGRVPNVAAMTLELDRDFRRSAT